MNIQTILYKFFISSDSGSAKEKIKNLENENLLVDMADVHFYYYSASLC